MDETKEFVGDMLLDYQKKHVADMYNLYHKKKLKDDYVRLTNNRVLLDNSDTGTGKTYTTCAIAKLMNLSLFVICPKAVIQSWYEVASLFELDILGITTYDTLKSTRVKNGYVNYFDMRNGFNTVPGKYDEYIYKRTKDDEVSYEWDFIETLIVFDEEQKSRNIKTLNAKLLKGAKNLIDDEESNRLILLSATPLEDKTQTSFLLDILGYEGSILSGAKNIFDLIYKSPLRREVSMRMPELEYNNIIDSVLVKVQDTKKIDKLHRRIYEIKHEKGGGRGKNLGEIVKLRNAIEQLKVSGIFDNIKEDLDDGKSVIIFVNFEPSMDKISGFLDENDIKHSIIHGQQDIRTRIKNMKLFNSGKRRVIISMIQAGGTGISLHDTKGDKPRIVYIFPPTSATILKQALGRAYRAGIKSNVKQNIVFADGKSNTVEVNMHNSLKSKLDYMDTVTKGEFDDFLGAYEKLEKI